MNKGLPLALLASAAVHVTAVAALHPPAPSQPPMALLVSLRQDVLPASLPAPPERPLRQKSASPARPEQARPVIPATAPASTVPTPAATPPAVASESRVVTAPSVVSPAPAALELPRYDAAYLANPPPPYPHSAKRRGIEGTALLEARVGTGGEAQEVKLAASAGDAALDDAALAAVRSWRFVPARRGSEAVEAWVRIPVVFRLN